MWLDRIVSLTPSGARRRATRDLKMGLFLTCLVFSLTACAQQSDLVKVEKDLEGKITKLDQEKRALAQVLKQAKQELADALEQQKAELNQEILQARAQLNDEILKARAQLKSELRSLREENLPKVVGDLERQLHVLRDNLEKALNQQGQKVGDQFAAFQASLREAIAGVNKQLAEEGKRATSAEAKIRGELAEEGKRAASVEAKIRGDFDKQLQAFRVKLDSDTQALKTYLETEVKATIQSVNAKMDADVESINARMNTELAGLKQTDTLHGKTFEEFTGSLTQLRDALGKTGTGLGAKLDSQGKDLEQTAKRVEQLQGQYAALAKKLEADVKGLHGYLEKDVRPSLASIAKAFGEEKNRVSQEFTKFQSGLQRVEQTGASTLAQAQAQVEAQAKHVRELGETVAGIREVMGSMAGTLGNRADQHMNQLGQLTARLEELEKKQSSEAAKQESNTRAVSTHLNEVTASVQSIGQSFEQFKGLVSTKFNEQANRIQAQGKQASKALGASSPVPDLEQGLKAQVTQLNELTKSVAQLKDVVETMGKKLGSKVDDHEAELIEGDKARKRSLNEVTASVQSVAQSFEEFKNLVSTRLNEQAARLQAQARQASEALGASSPVPDLEQGLKAQVTQLNELTKSVAQLKDVVETMGKKLGSKVDDHEAELIEGDKARKRSLNEVTASVQSVAQSFEEFKNLVSTRLNEQAARLQAQAQQASEALGASSPVPDLEQGLKAQVTQLNELTKSVTQLKDVVKTMGQKLGSKVDDHESQLNKQDVRLQAQAERASKALGASSAVPDLQQGVKANLTQLKKLAKSVAALKEVLSAMDEKLGSQVEAHESQLLKLQKAVNMFR